MQQEQKAKDLVCSSCGKVFTNMTRLHHHMAAEHSMRTAKDIPTMKNAHTMDDVPHSTGAIGGIHERRHQR